MQLHWRRGVERSLEGRVQPRAFRWPRRVKSSRLKPLLQGLVQGGTTGEGKAFRVPLSCAPFPPSTLDSVIHLVLQRMRRGAERGDFLHLQRDVGEIGRAHV